MTDENDHDEELDGSAAVDNNDDEELEKKKSKKKKHKKRGSSAIPSDERQKTYGKGKDMFPEFSSMPAFTNFVLDDDCSINSQATRYETKEDQDVAVFMALAGRMNLDSLLFILNGHAREMNLPSSEYLLPEKRSERDALLHKQKKKFQWKEDADGNVSLEVFEIESLKEVDMWWDDDFCQKILMSAIRDVRYYQANKADYITAVETLATQQDNKETEGHMKTMINDKHARGLEVHICSYIEEIRKDFINAVLDEQDDCEDAGEDYFATAQRLRQCALQYTVRSQEFAYKLAKCDHIVALKASLSKWDKPKPSKKKITQKITRSGSAGKKVAEEEVAMAEAAA